ncbi:MAG: glycerol-3-phosphate dehydrogenase/oxidase [Acidimicrobiia bacterium]
MSLGTFDRPRALRALAATELDVLVVGGGITGVGVALDAASRGLRTGLVERDDFSSGTSSRSSKLVHGGLRYLQNGEVRLVYEALHERQRLLRNAPHLVTLLPFLIPVTGRGGVVDRRLARALGSAMWMYDLTGGARIGRLHRRLRADEARDLIPTLPGEGLRAAYLYHDAAADDARLTTTVARTAALDHGALVANHAAVVELSRTDGRISGALVEADGRRFEVRARAVVNATGVWADEVRALGGGTTVPSIRPAKGVHVVVPWDLVRNRVAAVVPVPGDARTVFVIPWLPQGDGTFALTYVGTTDTDHDGPLEDPRCTPADVEYLLGALNATRRDGERPVRPDDVTATWAGLRPLVRTEGTGRTADLSRRHHIDTAEDGLVTVTGGKLTTYREMAEQVVDSVVGDLLGSLAGRPLRRCRTRDLPLRGARGWDEMAAEDPHLAHRYGTEARVVRAMVERDPALGRPLVEGLPYLRAEAVFAVRHEMALDLDDVLARRTRARVQDLAATRAALDDVAELLAAERSWSPGRTRAEADAYRAALEADEAPAS